MISTILSDLRHVLSVIEFSLDQCVRPVDEVDHSRRTDRLSYNNQLLPVESDIEVQNMKRYSSPVTGLDWPRGFREVKVPRFHDNGTGWW
jgi:hypothetical protein